MVNFVLSTLIAMTFTLVNTNSLHSTEGETAVVTWVVDGDSIEVEIDSRRERVRLLGINAPEFEHNGKAREKYAAEAFRYTKKKLKGKTVLLVRDQNVPDRDKYGRLLRYVYLKGKLFNAELIKKGFARTYTKSDFLFKEEFLKYEEEARRKEVGLWRYYK